MKIFSPQNMIKLQIRTNKVFTPTLPIVSLHQQYMMNLCQQVSSAMALKALVYPWQGNKEIGTR
jgi:hypothetical protein